MSRGLAYKFQKGTLRKRARRHFKSLQKQGDKAALEHGSFLRLRSEGQTFKQRRTTKQITSGLKVGQGFLTHGYGHGARGATRFSDK